MTSRIRLTDYCLRLAALVLLGCFVAGHALAAKTEARTALVIGNSAYSSAPLANPANDATDMAAVLKKLGFDVTVATNQNQRQMKLAIRKFGNELKERGGVGLFYYAGHGMEVGGTNFLIPVGSEIPNEEYVDLESVSMDEVSAGLASARNRMNIVILDACRNNPFARSWRSSSRGLAVMSAPPETLIAYATRPGDVAADGTGGRNGLYTEKLMEVIQQPGVRLVDVFRQTRAAVKKASGGSQVPWQSDDLTTGAFYFAPPSSSLAAVRPKRPADKGGFSLGDLDAAAKQEEAIRKQWQDRLNSMEAGFEEAKAYEKRGVSDGLKVKAWERFVSAYTEDDPYSTQDDQLREQARQRIDMLRSEVADLDTASSSGALRMVRIPAGAFVSGCSRDIDPDCHPALESEQTHEIQEFWIDVTEVTVGEYRMCASKGRCRVPHYEGSRSKECNWALSDRESHPMDCIDYRQAQQFCKWAGKRLPSEWEWEKAARGTDGRRYPWGNVETGCGYAILRDESGVGCGHGTTQPVGSRPAGASPYGALDMVGNVAEWTASAFTDQGYYKKNRVTRGGHYKSNPTDGRAADRSHSAQDWTWPGFGFRCAK